MNAEGGCSASARSKNCRHVAPCDEALRAAAWMAGDSRIKSGDGHDGRVSETHSAMAGPTGNAVKRRLKRSCFSATYKIF
jgi:hypothetical protein